MLGKLIVGKAKIITMKLGSFSLMNHRKIKKSSTHERGEKRKDEAVTV
jgi:hypothetical protein